VLPETFYDLPKEKTGKRFLSMLTAELSGIRERNGIPRGSSFSRLSAILQKKSMSSRASDIKKRLEWRMDAWAEGKYLMLVQETATTLELNLHKKQGPKTPDQRAKTFHQKVLKGDLRGAVRYLTERVKGGVLLPNNVCSKTGLRVLDLKHPTTREPDPDALHQYESLPEFIDVNVTEGAVEKTARKMPGAAGLGGVDSYTLKHWLLGFGKASQHRRIAVADIVNWMANGLPPSLGSLSSSPGRPTPWT
jgi:hypothetical protein